MGRPVIDLTGERFGLLEVIERFGYDGSGKVTWRCNCDCGDGAIVTGNNLRSGNTKRCGHDCALRGTQFDL